MCVWCILGVECNICCCRLYCCKIFCCGAEAWTCELDTCSWVECYLCCKTCSCLISSLNFSFIDNKSCDSWLICNETCFVYDVKWEVTIEVPCCSCFCWICWELEMIFSVIRFFWINSATWPCRISFSICLIRWFYILDEQSLDMRSKWCWMSLIGISSGMISLNSFINGMSSSGIFVGYSLSPISFDSFVMLPMVRKHFPSTLEALDWFCQVG